MLKELDIENLAIIKKSTIDFHKGFNVITGETGAGKSIIISALNMLLGGRANVDIIGPNGSECKIQAVFDLSLLEDDIFLTLPDVAKERELIISRVISKDKSRIYINGIISNISTLSEISSKIISLCSQNEQADLLNASYHLEVLDRYANLRDKLIEYRALFDNYKKLEKQYNDFVNKKNQTALRIAELNALKTDLERISLKKDRKSFLEKEIKKFTQIEKIQNISNEILSLLLEENGLFSLVSEIEKRLSVISRCDENVGSVEESFSNISSLITDFENEYNKYTSTLNLDDENLEELREELSLIASLERKYATNEAGLIALYESILNELKTYENFDNLETFKENVEKLKIKVVDFAEKISAERRKHAKKLENLVKIELEELNLPHANFKVLFNKTAVDETGVDDVEFMLSLNKGYDVKPLKRIASGGELSRILLVLKKILKDKYGVNVLVFDEVDSGMSGKTARAVGIKLKELAETSQVICITHLPQVASLADAHYVVFKNDSKNDNSKVLSQITKIKGDERIEEIARMLAGYEVTEASKASARELIAS